MAPRTRSGVEVPITWRGRRARAWVPATLATRRLDLAATTVARAAAAAAELGFGAAAMGTDLEALARLLLRAEGVASSAIEGVASPLADVALADAVPDAVTDAARAVAANLATVTAAVGDVDAPLTVDRLCTWHAALMVTSGLPARYVGTLRDEQGWIGGTSPLDAALVTPPPEYVPDLVADVVDFANRDDVDPVAQAAIVHAQFEIVHPFADGNGRLGRVLVSWLLVRRLALLTPPAVSVRIAADRDGYLSGLTMFRLGDHDRWVQWFADVAVGAGRDQVVLARAVDDLRASWRARLAAPGAGRALRRDALAWGVLDLMPRHLVLTASVVARELGRSARTAGAAIAELAAAGILVEHAPTRRGPGRPTHYYVAPELLALAAPNRARGGEAPGVSGRRSRGSANTAPRRP